MNPAARAREAAEAASRLYREIVASAHCSVDVFSEAAQWARGVWTYCSKAHDPRLPFGDRTVEGYVEVAENNLAELRTIHTRVCGPKE